jgi:cytochrome c-type biogenesis protein CcmH
MRVTGRGVARSDVVLLLAAVAVAMSVALAVVSSRPGSPEDRARAIERQLRCPTCQGLSIADSPATSATQMRVLVREQLAAGASDDAVRAFFVARYGRWILLDPPASGPDLALWLAPAAILAAGAVLVVRRARQAGPSGAARTWSALPALPVPRLGTLAVGTAMVLALTVPIVAAVGPRLAGNEISGGGIAQAGPSIEDLEAFVRAEPNDVDALVALGDALLAANRTADAADRYRAALELDPNNVAALLGVGSILLGADRPDAAGPVFDRILTLAPDQPDALLYRAVARLRLEGSPTDQVRRDVQRFLEVASPTDPRRALATGLLEPTATPSPGSSTSSFTRPTPP